MDDGPTGALHAKDGSAKKILFASMVEEPEVSKVSMEKTSTRSHNCSESGETVTYFAKNGMSLFRLHRFHWSTRCPDFVSFENSPDHTLKALDKMTWEKSDEETKRNGKENSRAKRYG